MTAPSYDMAPRPSRELGFYDVVSRSLPRQLGFYYESVHGLTCNHRVKNSHA